MQKRLNIKKISSLLPTQVRKKLNAWLNVHEVFYQNCENHDPWVNGSDPLGRGQYGQKNLLNLIKSSLLQYIFAKTKKNK